MTYRQLDYWLTVYGHLLGVEETSPGSGNPRSVPELMLPRLRVIWELRCLGFPLGQIMRYSHNTRLAIRGSMHKVLRIYRGRRHPDWR
jgi:hypothetical protein